MQGVFEVFHQLVLAVGIGLLLHHFGRAEADHVEGAREVYVDDDLEEVEGVRAELVAHFHGGADACAVDGAVERAKLLNGEIDCCLNARFVGDVAVAEGGLV